MNKNKSQIAMEFLLILVFVLVIITIVMYLIGIRTNEIDKNINKKEMEDFAQSILTEITIMEKMQEGYSRKIKIENQFIIRFNLSLDANRSYFTLTDTQNYDFNKLELFYYEFKENTNISLVNESGNFYLYLHKNQILNNSNSLILIN